MASIHSMPAGSTIPEAILELGQRTGLTTALVTGIGGVESLRVAWFNRKTKNYEEHRFNEFMEVTSLVGNLTMKGRKRFLHVHGNFGRRDLTVVGGHVISAKVFPILEVVLTPTTNTAFRRFDEETGLNLIYKTRG